MCLQEGILKPYVVFFGDNVPKPRVEQVGENNNNTVPYNLNLEKLQMWKKLFVTQGAKKHCRGGFFASRWFLPVRLFRLQVLINFTDHF